MSSKQKHAQWWQLYAMLPVLAGLFVLEIRLGLTGTENVLAQLGILFLAYGFIHLWISTNRRALMELDEDAEGQPGEWRIKVYEFPAAEEVGKQRRGRPIFQVPDAGLKGVLSTTFEMDELEEATSFPAGSEISYSESVFSTKNTAPIRGQADTKV